MEVGIWCSDVSAAWFFLGNYTFSWSFYQQQTQHVVTMLAKLILGVSGVYIAYLSMSFFTEALYNTDFIHRDPTFPTAKFSYPAVNVWLSCLLCSIAGFFIALIKKEGPNPIKTQEKIIMGGLFAVNMVTTASALLYISYPVQVIGRNIRFLFVVIVGAFFSRIKKLNSHLKLGKHKVFIASIITIGVLLFNFSKESKKDKADKHDPNLEWLGYLLLGTSVIVDAFFSDSQAFSKVHFKPTANQLFTSTNTYSFLFCVAYQALIDRTLVDSVVFIWNYPRALIYILGIAGLQVVGQVSIYYIVSNFKQHIFPLVSTTRKILSVIMSIFVFGHYVNNIQWVAIGIVFFGMFYEFYEELKHEKHKDDRAEGKAARSQSESESEPFDSPRKSLQNTQEGQPTKTD